MWLQKMPFIVKLLLYVIVFLFLSLFIIVALSLMFEPETEEISGWVYTVGFVLSLVISVAGGIEDVLKIFCSSLIRSWRDR